MSDHMVSQMDDRMDAVEHYEDREVDIAKARKQYEQLRHKPHTLATWAIDWGIPLMDRVEELEEELRLWKPLTPEEAETELAKAEAEPMSDDEINAIVSKVLDPAYSPTNSESAQLAARVKALEQQVKEQNPPADERRIWWPEPDACGWYVWPDANLCPPLYETGHWFARPLSSQEGELFQTKEEAAKWLYDQKCGPYHPQPDTKGGV